MLTLDDEAFRGLANALAAQVVVFGIALLRITDPDAKSGTLDDYAYAYLYIAPVEIALVSLSPLAFYYGYGWAFVTVCAILGAASLAFAALRGWLKKPSGNE